MLREAGNISELLGNLRKHYEILKHHSDTP